MSNEHRYCIGCVFFDMTPREPGCMGSTWTGIYGDEEAASFCQQGHWRFEHGTQFTLEDFRQHMEKAQKCADYEERPAP